MKKVLLKISLSVFCVLFATVIFAQEQKGNIEFGVKGGLNLANMHNFSHYVRPGIHAGVFAEYTLNDFFGIQGELLYSMTGAVVNDYTTGSIGVYPELEVFHTKATYKYDYIVLPVLAKLYVTKGLSLDLGPQFGYMVLGKLKLKDQTPETVDYYDNVDGKFDAAFAAGLSYKLGNRFDISGRYNLGLTKRGYFDETNNVIQFGIGYRFK